MFHCCLLYYDCRCYNDFFCRCYNEFSFWLIVVVVLYCILIVHACCVVDQFILLTTNTAITFLSLQNPFLFTQPWSIDQQIRPLPNFSTFPENSIMQTPIDVPSYSTRNIDTRLPTTLNKYTPIEPFLLTRLPYSTASPTLAKYQHRLRDNSLLTVIRPFTKENINFFIFQKIYHPRFFPLKTTNEHSCSPSLNNN